MRDGCGVRIENKTNSNLLEMTIRIMLVMKLEIV